MKATDLIEKQKYNILGIGELYYQGREKQVDITCDKCGKNLFKNFTYFFTDTQNDIEASCCYHWGSECLSKIITCN